MASPETGDDTSITGRWVTVQPGLGDSFTNVLDTVNSLVNTLLNLLNVALTILEVIKAFLVGFTDPILAILEAIVDEIESLLLDIRQIGIYMTGDLQLGGGWPYSAIIGGFSAYERRMIGRLVDKSDPTRPDFTSASAVVAIFLYASADVSAVTTLINIINSVIRFFGQRVETRSLGVPVGLEVTYGLDGTTLDTFGTLTEALEGGTPNVANLKWSMAMPPQVSTVAWPLPSPKGFLIEVSTVREGLLLSYEAPTRAAILEDSGTDKAQSRKAGLLLDPSGSVLRLYGGAEQIDVGDLSHTGIKTGMTFQVKSPAFDSGGNLKEGAVRILAYKDSGDNVPIPVDALVTDDGKYLLQRTFFVDTSSKGSVLSGPGEPFSVTLAHEDMPWDADFRDSGNGEIEVKVIGNEPATTVYFRVVAVSDNVTSADSDDTGTFKWDVDSTTITSDLSLGNTDVRVFAKIGSKILNHADDRGTPSFPLVVTFPGAKTKEYLDTVTAALCVLVLSRSDLPVSTPVEESETTQKEIEALQANLSSFQENLESQRERLNELRNLFFVTVDVDDQLVLQSEISSQQAAIREQESIISELETTISRLESDVSASKASGFQIDTARVETGLEDIARFLMPQMLGNNAARYFMREDAYPPHIRQDVLTRARALANDLYSKTGPLGSALEEFVSKEGEGLLSFKWSDVDTQFVESTILESLDTSGSGTGEDTSQGVGLNFKSIGIPTSAWRVLTETGSSIERTPGFHEETADPDKAAVWRRGSADNSPVLYSDTGEIRFIRNVLLDYDNGRLLSEAATVLSIAASPLSLSKTPGEGNWRALRLFPQGIPAIEQSLDIIIGWARTLLAGSQGVVDLIVAYIEFVEARILELEAILRRIQSLLNVMLSFQLPSMSGLIITADGTDGILQGLVTADDKPFDASDAYGAGLVLMAGGLPSALIDFLQLLFPTKE